jgi:hypothetical protein
MSKVGGGGVDATQDGLAAVQAGDLDVNVSQDAAGQGKGSLDTALKLAKGEKAEKKVYIPFNSSRLPKARTSSPRTEPKAKQDAGFARLLFGVRSSTILKMPRL